jgi:hypothetical protein
MFSAAFLDIFLSAAAMLLTTGFAWLRCVAARSSGIRHTKAMLRPLHLSKRVPWVLPYSDSRSVGISFQETRL